MLLELEYLFSKTAEQKESHETSVVISRTLEEPQCGIILCTAGRWDDNIVVIVNSWSFVRLFD